MPCADLVDINLIGLGKMLLSWLFSKESIFYIERVFYFGSTEVNWVGVISMIKITGWDALYITFNKVKYRQIWSIARQLHSLMG